jgi:hypothetical protein
MRPTGSEVHDLLLVHPKHTVQRTPEKQGQMHERAQPSIRQQHVARLQFGVHLGDPRLIVRA